MAYVSDKLSKVGTKLVAKNRGKDFPITVTKMPFVPAKYYRV